MKKRNSNLKFAVFTAIFCLLAFSSISFAASSIYVQFDGIQGESTDHEHNGWSDVRSYSEKLSVPVSSSTGTTRPDGRVDFSPIIIHKFVDTASAPLRLALGQGQVIPIVTIEFVRTGDSPLTFLRIVLRDAILTLAEMALDTSEDRPLEKIGISFERIEWIYTTTDSQGHPGGQIIFNWDLMQNGTF